MNHNQLPLWVEEKRSMDLNSPIGVLLFILVLLVVVFLGVELIDAIDSGH